MNTYPEQFPEERRADPRRRAEAQVFDAIRASNLPGFAYYEYKKSRTSPELDFALWIQDEARFGLQVKGGRYLLEKGKWYLITQNGREKKSSPLRRTWDATMSLKDNLSETLEQELFFIAVLIFPDMELDAAIAEMGERSHAPILWGTDRLVERLVDIAAETVVHYPPGLEDIRREVDAVTGHQVAYLGEDPDGNHLEEAPPLLALPEAPRGARLEIAGGSITIQHVDTLVVHSAPGPAPDAGGLLQLPD